MHHSRQFDVVDEQRLAAKEPRVLVASMGAPKFRVATTFTCCKFNPAKTSSSRNSAS